MSISYDSRWQRQMVFMVFDWKMTHTPPFSDGTGTTVCVRGVNRELKHQSKICKFKNSSSWKKVGNKRIQSQLRQTIFGGSYRGQKARYFLSLYISEANLPDYMWPGSEQVKRVHVCWGLALSFLYYAWIFSYLTFRNSLEYSCQCYYNTGQLFF